MTEIESNGLILTVVVTVYWSSDMTWHASPATTEHGYASSNGTLVSKCGGKRWKGRDGHTTKSKKEPKMNYTIMAKSSQCQELQLSPSANGQHWSKKPPERSNSQLCQISELKTVASMQELHQSSGKSFKETRAKSLTRKRHPNRIEWLGNEDKSDKRGLLLSHAYDSFSYDGQRKVVKPENGFVGGSKERVGTKFLSALNA